MTHDIYSSIVPTALCKVYFQTDTSNWASDLKKIGAAIVNETIDGIMNYGDPKTEELLRDLCSAIKVTSEEEFIALCKKIILAAPDIQVDEKELDEIFSKKYECSKETLAAAVTLFNGYEATAIYFEYNGSEIKVYVINNGNFKSDFLFNRNLFMAAQEDTGFEYYWQHAETTEPDLIIS